MSAEFLGMVKVLLGTASAGFIASTRINRKDLILSWNVALETSGWLVGETIEISIELELAQVVETELATAVT